ncbi:MAG: MFS transporter [Bifidobacterium crudilactis]|jgi:MFS transporter, DHA1 family, arabinose polymer utilization protein|uniref:MFS transporter n=1 Tax=Bifidobacterium crudilactis TaxID=327277 RepID=UPI003A5BD27D
MKKSLLALAAGAFALGAAEFVMMGILPQAAEAMHVSIPSAGHFISAYAIGVCAGTVILVFGRKIPPKRLILAFIVLIIIGNLLSALSLNAPMLIAARFIAGLPHGAFFGTATLIAKSVADPGKEAKAVSMMVTGQTVANMIGVPAGTLLAQHMSWRMTFAALSIWALLTLLLVALWVPDVAAIKDAGIAGQFRFLRRRGPWFILGAVFVGNTGIFCWWSYVSPWLIHIGGFSASVVPALMMLAGFGMVVGGLSGGILTDNWRHAGTAALGQSISAIGLLLVFLIPGSAVSTGILTFWVAFGLFFISSPQQILMVEAGEGGGELIGGAAVQVAFNLGNAVGSLVGGIALADGGDYHLPALAGVPFAVFAVVLLIVYSWRHETHTGAINRLRQVHPEAIGSTPETTQV